MWAVETCRGSNYTLKPCLLSKHFPLLAPEVIMNKVIASFCKWTVNFIWATGKGKRPMRQRFSRYCFCWQCERHASNPAGGSQALADLIFSRDGVCDTCDLSWLWTSERGPYSPWLPERGPVKFVLCFSCFTVYHADFFLLPPQHTPLCSFVTDI